MEDQFFTHTHHLLRTSLMAAVPLRILTHLERGGISDEQIAQARADRP